MLLLWLLAVSQEPVIRPQFDLSAYLAVAARYASGERVAGLREIRTWRSVEIDAAIAALRRREEDLRAGLVAPPGIDFRLVESAVLLHAEAGLLALQALSTVDADWHLRTSQSLYEWSREAAPALRVRHRIDPRDYYLALSATSLAFGNAPTARAFAGRARDAAPLDAEVRVLAGCAAEALAEEHVLRHEASEAEALLGEADRFLRDALSLDPSRQEARLRLGRLLLVRGRLIEAGALLEEVEAQTGDDRQRYLARLSLGRLAERRGRRDDAARLYARALEGWPDSQTARLALAHVLEKASGPPAARPLVAASLSASQRLDRAADPWWLYPYGPPGLAKAALDRVWGKALDR